MQMTKTSNPLGKTQSDSERFSDLGKLRKSLAKSRFSEMRTPPKALYKTNATLMECRDKYQKSIQIAWQFPGGFRAVFELWEQRKPNAKPWFFDMRKRIWNPFTKPMGKFMKFHANNQNHRNHMGVMERTNSPWPDFPRKWTLEDYPWTWIQIWTCVQIAWTWVQMRRGEGRGGGIERGPSGANTLFCRREIDGNRRGKWQFPSVFWKPAKKRSVLASFGPALSWKNASVRGNSPRTICALRDQNTFRAYSSSPPPTPTQLQSTARQELPWSEEWHDII